MGASISGVGNRETPPLIITGSELHGITYDVPVPSAQVKSAILLAGLRASGETVVREAVRTRTATEDMLANAGITITSEPTGEGRVIRLQPGRPSPQQWQVPTDPSQAAFFAVLGLIAARASITILDVESSPERIGFVNVLQRLGGDIDVEDRRGVSTLTVRSSDLHATEIHATEIPSVDEAPILSIAAAAATGVTVFRDMGELRLKESDRFEGCMLLARSVGANSWADGDDFYIEGLGSARNFQHFSINPGLDHRMVMSAAVAGTAGSGCIIENPETVSSSYPGFFTDLASLS
jgi:3-phosphoshikimate 1-carboxyvinyltransferase